MFWPASTNALYSGSKWSAYFLVLSGFLELAPGCVHYFLPDGGAGVIAGLDLSHDRTLILGVFAWMGSMQIPFGIALMTVGLRYRSLVPLFLLLNLVERVLMALAGWVFKSSPAGHHPPEHYASIIAALLLGCFLYLSLKPVAERGSA